MSTPDLKTRSRLFLLGVLVPLLKKHGFTKRRFRWYRTCGHVIQLVDIQKSQWGDDYYLNLGIYDLRLGAALRPPIYDCHARLRTTSLELPPGCSDDALDFQKRVSPASRKRQIEQVIERCGLVWLNQVSQDKGMREYLRSRVSRFEWVVPELRRLHRVRR